jgi:ribose transport system substrate-binding protein/inositol transport system substrate-binding protein
MSTSYVRGLFLIVLVMLLASACVVVTPAPQPQQEAQPQSQEQAPEQEPQAEQEEAAAGETVDIAAQVLTTEIEYFEQLRQAYITAAEAKGYNIVTGDAQADPQQQTNFIEDQVAKGVDVIIVSIVDAATAQPAIEEAISKGVPVIVQGQEPEDFPWATGNVGYSEETMGQFAGELVAQCLKEKMPDVETYTGVSCQWPDWPSTQRRDAAAIKAVEENADKPVEWVLEQKCGTRQLGLETVEAALVNEPDLHFVVGVNDGSSIGAVAAYEAAGLDPAARCIAGPNNDFEVRQYVADGKVYATVDLNHQGLADAAIDLAGKLAAGEEIPKMTYVDMVKVTKDNIDDWPR